MLSGPTAPAAAAAVVPPTTFKPTTFAPPTKVPPIQQKVVATNSPKVGPPTSNSESGGFSFVH